MKTTIIKIKENRDIADKMHVIAKHYGTKRPSYLRKMIRNEIEAFDKNKK